MDFVAGVDKVIRAVAKEILKQYKAELVQMSRSPRGCEQDARREADCWGEGNLSTFPEFLLLHKTYRSFMALN
jgi:hypothetical protein